MRKLEKERYRDTEVFMQPRKGGPQGDGCEKERDGEREKERELSMLHKQAAGRKILVLMLWQLDNPALVSTHHLRLLEDFP